MLSSKYLPFVSGGTCEDSTEFSALTTTICWCPLSASIATCSCDLTAGSTTTITVNCTSQGLGDASIASVLSSISVTSPLDTLLLGGNNLTKVPSSSSRQMTDVGISRASSTSLLTQFPLLNYVSLSSNAITSILKGDLTLSAPLKFLDVSSNQISRVAVGSFPCENNIYICLIRFYIYFVCFCLHDYSELRKRGSYSARQQPTDGIGPSRLPTYSRLFCEKRFPHQFHLHLALKQ